MDAIVMAGGKGTRMMPLTAETPKPLLVVAGRPILEWSLLALRPSASRVIVVAKYLKPQIDAYMARQTVFSDYVVVEQNPEPLGTGHAVQVCADVLTGDRFLVMNGDDLFNAGAIARLAAEDAGLLAIAHDEPSRFGVVVTDADGRVLRLHEKPAPGTYPPPVRVNIGLYKLTSAVLGYDLPRSPRGEYELTDYVTRLAQETPVRMVETDFWFPIGDPAALAAAQALDVERLVLG
jgi:bifunctional UDP-N-acetylglucosamine pyrophosphorylase/glucosamine-1-phosphate N-acetyltransferase